MSEISYGGRQVARQMPPPEHQSANLADLLERILDKGIVIVGDIRVNLLDIELLTVKLRLLVASVDRAKELGIDWWEHDPSLSSRARQDGERSVEGGRAGEVEGGAGGASDQELAEENRRLRERLAALEAAQQAPQEPAEDTDTQRSAPAGTQGRKQKGRAGSGEEDPS